MNYREKIRKAIECPQFGNDGYGEWGALRLEQRVLIKRLLDELDNADNCVKRLYEENEELKSQLKGTTHCYDEEEHRQLKQENEKLKKQLEEYKEQVNKGLYSTCLPYKTGYDKAVENYKTQQQEFIKYLEDEIERKRFNATCMFEYNDTVLPLKEILQKYKETIGENRDE